MPVFKYPVVQLADSDGVLINPATGTGGGGGGGATGSVTAAGTNGTTAQAVQGITGGVPQNVNVVSGGSLPSGAYGVQRTANIGTTAVLVSAATAQGRRTVRNIGTTALEIVAASGDTYGVGHPLPAGESFTFDDSGRTTAAIYCVGVQAGGAVSVITY